MNMIHFFKNIALGCCLLVCSNLCSGQATEKIHTLEYFFNTDPGFGAGTQVAITNPATVLNNVAVTPNVSALSNGLHRFNIRVQDSSYRWSNTTSQMFYKEAVVSSPVSNIDSAEYFIDTDPGFGLGVPFTVAPGPVVSTTFSGFIGSLPQGLHMLYTRVRNTNGFWSHTNTQVFYKEAAINNPTQNVVNAEYFIDTDPGFGNATSIPVTAAGMVSFSFNPAIATVNNGLHILYVRTKDAAGKWSLTSNQIFYKEAIVNSPVPNIIAAEYFVDTDPGFGQGNAFTVAAGNVVSTSFSAVIGALPAGLHTLYTRVKDANGKWSLSNTQLFYREPQVNLPVPNVVAAEYFIDVDPGFGQAMPETLTAGNLVTFNVNASINSITNGLHKFYVRTKDAAGNWSLTTNQVFYKEAVVNNLVPNVVGGEFFIDVDPGFGNANPIAMTSPSATIMQNFTPAISSLTKGLHVLYTRLKDANGKWTLTNRQLFYYEPAFTPAAIGELVKFEWFFDVDPGFGNATAVPAPAANNGQVTNFMFNVPLNPNLAGSKHNFYLRVLDDWSLTTVVVVDFTSTVLPVTLLEFTARAETNFVTTNWSITQEINTSYYDVEHSADGVSFRKFGTVQALGSTNGARQYNLNHYEPVNGVNYYRLKMVDADGRFTYSPIATVVYSKANMPVAFPNPVQDLLTLKIPPSFITTKLSLTINDVKGAVVIKQLIANNISTINCNNLSAGTYFLSLRNEAGKVLWQQSIQKQ